MYNFPPPYSNYYKSNIRKPQKRKNNIVPTQKSNYSSKNSNQTHSTSVTDNNICINILGIKLYLDDLIILFIIFILYKENDKDNELIICLLLLLFT